MSHIYIKEPPTTGKVSNRASLSCNELGLCSGTCAEWALNGIRLCIKYGIQFTTMPGSLLCRF